MDGLFQGSVPGGILVVMTTTTADPALKPCQCGDPGCDKMVKGTYARGHYAKMARNTLARLPGPDDDPDEADDPDAPGPGSNGHLSQADLDVLADSMQDNADEPEPEIPADRPAGRLKEPRGKTSAAKTRIRVTAAVKRDVHAKIRFGLVPAGRVWQARDPVCGGTFLMQEPEISTALADIVCDSPDLLAWFTGPAGGFMKYFNLIMALQPVALTMWAHHIAHLGDQGEMDGQQPPQMPAYAA